MKVIFRTIEVIFGLLLGEFQREIRPFSLKIFQVILRFCDTLESTLGKIKDLNRYVKMYYALNEDTFVENKILNSLWNEAKKNLGTFDGTIPLMIDLIKKLRENPDVDMVQQKLLIEGTKIVNIG